MILNELYDEDELNFSDPAEDNSVPRLNDLRKTKLTLGQINRMRLISDVRKFEKAQDLENIRRQYGAPAGEGNGLV